MVDPKKFKKQSETIHANELVSKIGEDIILPVYQRGLVWPLSTTTAFLVAIYDNTFIPPIIISDLVTGETVLTDGKQRLETFSKLFNNKIKLPKVIPSEEGGGKFLKDAPQKTQEKYKFFMLDLITLSGLTALEAQKIFLNLQKGVPLTNGEIIHANFGHHWEAVNRIVETHPIIPKISSARNAEYRIIVTLFLQELNIVDSISKKDEINFIEAGYEDSWITPDNYQNIITFLDKIYKITKTNAFQVSQGRLLALYQLFNKRPSLYRMPNKKLSEFMRIYFNNQSILKKNKNMDIRDKNVVSYINSSTLRYSNSEEVKRLVNHMIQEIKLYNNGDMIQYDEEILLELKREQDKQEGRNV